MEFYRNLCRFVLNLCGEKMTNMMSDTSCPLLWLITMSDNVQSNQTTTAALGKGYEIYIVRENNAMFDKTLRESAIGRSWWHWRNSWSLELSWLLSAVILMHLAVIFPVVTSPAACLHHHKQCNNCYHPHDHHDPPHPSHHHNIVIVRRTLFVRCWETLSKILMPSPNSTSSSILIKLRLCQNLDNSKLRFRSFPYFSDEHLCCFFFWKKMDRTLNISYELCLQRDPQLTK